MNWYYVDAAGQQAGPVDDAGLDALGASGKITGDTLVWREGMANWQPYREVRPSAAAISPVASAAGGEEAVCAECGGIFPISDTIRIGNSRVCANCKPVFVQKMREGVNVDNAGGFQYAGFWIRLLAYIVDAICLGIVNLGINFAFGFGFMGARVDPSEVFSPLRLVLMAVQLGMALTYETVMIGKYGATLGKMACKIHVINPDGTKVSYAKALGRYFGKLVSSFTCLIGFIMAGFDAEKRALHDRICNTRVVKN